MTDYPWLEPALLHLVDLHASGRLPHGLLLSGPAGIGKLGLAHGLAGALLCPDRQGATPCGKCPACAQLASGGHPDYRLLTYATDEKTGKRKTAIVVDQVRALIESLALGSHAGGMKVVVIAPADAMNISAANSLLKTLEEPTDNTVLVLVSDRPATLPATIRSRCQQVRMELPARDQALAWLSAQIDDPAQAERALDAAGGAPLRALELAGSDTIDLRRTRVGQLEQLVAGKGSLIEIAGEWSEDRDLCGMRWLRDWIMDLVRIDMTGDVAMSRNSDVKDVLVRLAGRLKVQVLFQQVDAINRLLKSDGGGLNRQLMTEDILLGLISSR